MEISLIRIVPELAPLREACAQKKPESRFIWEPDGFPAQYLSLVEKPALVRGQALCPKRDELMRFTNSSPPRLTVCDPRVHEMVSTELLERVRSGLSRACLVSVILDQVLTA